ncbi:MAG: GNAT family N-acetyltransferase [Candidatus Paceibacterota bacterium]|jgi:L-amino acid N-acyltransferase YncA
MLKIRAVKKSDIPALARIYKNAYDASGTGESWSIKRAQELLVFYYQTKTFIGLTAIYDEKICGAFFSYVKPWWNGKYLAEGELFIHPKFQGEKIGTALYLAMMKRALKEKCFFHALLAYKRASLWYKKIGLKETRLKHMSGDVRKIITAIKNNHENTQI